MRWEPEGVYCRFYDQVCLQDILDFNDRLYGDKRFGEMKFQIVDHTDMSVLILKDHEMKIVATLDRSSSVWNAKMKIAVVSTHEGLIASTNVYKEKLKDTKWETEVFETERDARLWIMNEHTVN